MLNLSKALLKAQKEMASAIKDSKNPFFKSKYSDYNSVREAVIPPLNNNGIVVMQPTIYQDGKSFIKTILLHESGEQIDSLTEIVCSKPNDPQAWGSALSYGKRYSLQSFMCVGQTDDDGEVAMVRAEIKPAYNNTKTKITKDDEL